MLIAARRIGFRVANPKIMHDKIALKNDSRLSLYPIVATKQTKTGIMMLNKPDNNNNITLECADELYRFLTSYHHDHTVENVWIENKGSSFSGGVDYDELLRNPDYLDRLMRLSIMIGEFNKPIFAKVFGSVRGIGAYLLPMFSTPLGTDKSTLKLDETSKGFIPIFGGSHRLSRLPCNIGIYLALTGDKLTGDEMARLGFLRGKVRDEHTNKQIHRHLSNANLFMRYTYSPSSLSLSAARRENILEYKKNYFNDLITHTQQEIFKSEGKFYNKLALNQYRIAQTQYYNTINPYNSLSQSRNYIATNYFQMRHDRPFNYLKKQGIVEEGNTYNNLLARLPVPKLIKVFNRDTVQGVLEELAKDGSEWAKQTEQMIRKKDPLAVHLTFHLIKNAQKLCWVQCVQEEYKVARRILNISEVKNIETSSGKTLTGLKNKYSNEKLQNITIKIVDEFMKPSQNQSEIFDHDTPNHSFLPTSDYWREFPDAGRNYLNRTFFEDYHGKFGQLQVIKFLNYHKIDYRDSSFNIPTLREYMHKKINYDRLIEMERQRIRGIFQSDKYYSNLKNERQKFLSEKLKSPNLPELVTAQIQQYFEQKFNTRFDELKKTAEIAGKESRMGIIRKYVATLTENIVFNGRKIEQEDRVSNLRHEGIVRIDDKGNNVFLAENKYEQSFQELQDLKNAYINRNEEGIKNISSDLPHEENMFTPRLPTQYETDLLKRDAALQENYNVTIIPRRMAYKYRSLMEKAAETSQEIAGMLQWENSDIQTIIMNAPKSQSSFKEFAEKTLSNAPRIEERIAQLNRAYDALLQFKQKKVDSLLESKNQKTVIGNVFFDEKIIPPIFRSVHLSLFEQVLNFYSQKYRINNKISNLNQDSSNPINNWALDGLQSNFTKLMKSDVEYTFSYLVILHLKQMLVELSKSKNLEGVLKNKFGIDISGWQYKQFNKMFMTYLYSVLDLHEESKHKIIFPQTKVIEFLKCFKLNSRTNMTFQNLMLLIAKDRKMIRDSMNGEIPLLGYNPEVNLNALVSEAKDNKKFPNIQQINNDNLYKLNLQPRMNELASTKGKPTQQKKLVLGFTHYLRRFEAMLQQVASSTMFLPKSLYKYEGKQTYELAKDLLKIELSNEDWFNQKLKSAVRSLLDFRYEKQQYMSQGELALFDQEFSELFSSDLLGLVIRYEISTEELIAKILIGSQKKQIGTNDQIKNLYLDVKSQVKNPRALRMLNNLIMTQNVIRERIIEAEQTEYNTKKKEKLTSEEEQDLTPQKNRRLNPKTLRRLVGEAFRYADDQGGVNERNVQNARIALGRTDSDQRKDNLFLSELKHITKLIQENDFKAELEDRIRRVQNL